MLLRRGSLLVLFIRRAHTRAHAGVLVHALPRPADLLGEAHDALRGRERALERLRVAELGLLLLLLLYGGREADRAPERRLRARSGCGCRRRRGYDIHGGRGFAVCVDGCEERLYEDKN